MTPIRHFPFRRMVYNIGIMDNKLLIIIPAYNEAASIVKTVDTLTTQYPQFDYIIVNDGSRDETLEICRRHNYRVIDQSINLGLSGTFQTGVRYALRHDYTAILQFDADGQHLPAYIQPMLDKLNEGFDIVIGSRFVTKKKKLSLRMLGSRIITFSIRLVTGKKISDPTSGMRMYGKRLLKPLSIDPNLTPEPDTIAYLIKSGAKAAEVQVEMKEREAGKSYLNATRSMIYMAVICTSSLILSWFRPKLRFEEESV